MESSDIFFSIVIPTYNRAAFLHDTVTSVLNQTFPGFEVILVDDGSKDNTLGVVQTLTHPKLKYFLIENGERGRARNYGLKQARGQYVVFFDSDDYMLPSHLEVLAKKIRQTGNPNFIATKFRFNRNGRIVDSDVAPIKEGFYPIDLFLNGNMLACNFAVRRENPGLKLFEEDRGYAVIEDWMFLLENLQSDRMYIVDEVTIHMNDHDNRSMKAESDRLIQKLLKARQWMEQHVSLKKSQHDVLVGNIYYLAAIHAYADGKRKKAIGLIFEAARYLTFQRKLLMLGLKSLIGVGLLQLVKERLA